MKNLLLAATVILGSAAAASADGIQPIGTTEPLDVTMGSVNSGIDPVYAAVAGGALLIILAAGGEESDGTN